MWGARVAAGVAAPGGTHAVTIERLTAGAWQPLTTLRTAADGSFRDAVAVRTGDRLRVAWPEPEPEPDAGPPPTASQELPPGAATPAATRAPHMGYSGTVVVPAATTRTRLVAATRFPPAAASAAAAIMSAP